MWSAAALIPNHGHRIGDYEIIRPVGQGGFGIVYLAYDLQQNRNVALKLPRMDTIANQDRRDRFEREAQICADLDHPAIVQVHEAKLNVATPYIASAYYPGPDLGAWLSHRGQPVPWRQAVEFIVQLADAVQYAHDRGVIHRDLKPSNILLAFKETNPEKQENTWERCGLEDFQPKLTDFGMAKSLVEEQVNTRSSMLVGTPLYMAPEHFDGSEANSPAAAVDIYALGCLLFEVVTGKAPFAGGSYLEVVEAVRISPAPRLLETNLDVPKELDTICRICLEKEPKNRYSSVAELTSDLQNCLTGKQIAGRPPSVWQRFQTWTRHPVRILQAGLYTFVIHLVLMVWVLFATSLTILQPSLFSKFDIDSSGFSQLYADAAFIVLTMHLPMIIIGWQTRLGRGWAVCSGAILSIICIIPPLLLCLGKIEMFADVYRNSEYHRLAMAALIFILMTFQLAFYAIALIAHCRKTPRG